MSSLVILGDWNAKVGTQEIPEGTGKFDLGVQNEAGPKVSTLQKSLLISFV